MLLKLPLVLITVTLFVMYFLKVQNSAGSDIIKPSFDVIDDTSSTTTTTQPIQTPPQKILENNYHIYQTFNNCGPASLSMALSYYGIDVNQQELGNILRPYQNTQGDNDDKSTTLYELANEAEKRGFTAYYRPAGDLDLLKRFVANDMPVITRTLTALNEDVGHYRVIKGYDDETQELIQDDSLQGKNLRYGYTDFKAIWQKFNYEYLVLVTAEKRETAERIIGENIDEHKAWQQAANLARDELEINPHDPTTGFNLSVALYNIGKIEESSKEFEKVEYRVSQKALWYQIEPILAYYKLKRYDRVFELTERIFNNHNKAFAELYYMRSLIYKEQGNEDAAQDELNLAKFYNSNLDFEKVLGDIR